MSTQKISSRELNFNRKKKIIKSNMDKTSNFPKSLQKFAFSPLMMVNVELIFSPGRTYTRTSELEVRPLTAKLELQKCRKLTNFSCRQQSLCSLTHTQTHQFPPFSWLNGCKIIGKLTSLTYFHTSLYQKILFPPIIFHIYRQNFTIIFK